MTSTTSDARSVCANCSRPLRGSFCTNCGAIAEASACASCDGALEPGDRHCAACGAPAGAGARSGSSRDARTPWAVAGIAFVALILVVLIQKANDVRSAGMAQAVDPQAAQTVTPAGGPAGVDINSMTPREMMARLYDRVMVLKEQGKADSAAFFASMANQLAASDALQPHDADIRYDLGTIANATGDFTAERAQADTLLSQSPDHLLGLLMAARNARARRDAAAAKQFDARLVRAAESERARQRPEYQQHAREIDDALKTARGQ